ncbi:E3 ubiquitin-protein ligase RNF180-like [Sphaeramia orbicularis]|uniref:E3 ubiquitin-protein ligase RNF180-like n=1 Tax=Sphaeramia orbicularis TaxID=375764 RepID=A0A672Z5I7_9TELE|nr:E3 ubiquitin-protein ligase RNF180-like [Sphaeramia orbicularis]
MLRCRKCRKGVIDSTCLSAQVEAAHGDSADVCSIWHVDADAMPDWIHSAVHQAQWTLGKLNCPSCGARLGGFNFVHGGECPCGRDAAVHLSKSRVDRDHKHYVLIVQPRRTRPPAVQPGPPMDRIPDLNRAVPLNPGLQLDCAAVVSHVSPGHASKSLSGGGDAPSFSFSPLNCISHRRRCSLDDDTIRASCFCRGVLSDKSSVETVRTDVSVPCPTARSWDADEGPTGLSHVSEDRGSAVDQAHQDTDPSVLDPWIHEEVSDPGPILRDRNGEDSEDEQDDDETRQTSSTSNRLNKREKNRLKSLRRKQRRRERWLHRQLEQEQGNGVNVSPQEADDADREGVTCAVCLDVYFSPYTCRPCDHVFCEPCLRTLAKNRHANTPCPLCRTLITHTSFNKELHHAAKIFFPKVYVSRKQNFQNAPCSKWPLPSCRKRFRNLWGSQRRVAEVAGGRWRLTPAVFMLDALDLTDMRGWLFDIALVIVYIHSVNWILAALLFGFLTYYFLC